MILNLLNEKRSWLAPYRLFVSACLEKSMENIYTTDTPRHLAGPQGMSVVSDPQRGKQSRVKDGNRES